MRIWHYSNNNFRCEGVRRKKGGNAAIDVSYQWLVFFEEDDKNVKKLYEDYKKGTLLSGELKQMLIKKLTTFLEQHQTARKKAQKLVDKFKYTGKLAKNMWEFQDF